MKQKKGIIYSVDSDTLQQYIKESKTYGQVLKRFDLENRGRNPYTLKKRIKEENLDDSNITTFIFGGGWNTGTKGVLRKRMTLEKALKVVFIKNAISKKQKSYIRAYNLIPEICGECNITTVWNNKPITLELDHIDGDSNNNELSNLRWLCPNCHSQTPTFRGRKLKKKYFCECGKENVKTSTRCNSCEGKHRKVVGPQGIEPCSTG